MRVLSRDELETLYQRYLGLVRTEIEDFGVRPTEVRHLVGRLGEFYCALQVGGTLVHHPNQHGFDVICSKGRRISVKTTAQRSGFVAIGKSTIDKVDDLMVVQYRDGKLETLYCGPVEVAVQVCRFYDYSGKHELDISKARRLVVARVTGNET